MSIRIIGLAGTAHMSLVLAQGVGLIAGPLTGTDIGDLGLVLGMGWITHELADHIVAVWDELKVWWRHGR